MKLNFPHIAAILGLALLGWAFCGVVMYAGMSLFSQQTALVIHAIAAPIIFSAISWFYFSKLGYIKPLSTAVLFTVTVLFMDFFVVALVVNQSLDMFQSILGTWIPFGLIFLSTYLMGLAIKPQGYEPKRVQSW